jgi:hypothetical protein
MAIVTLVFRACVQSVGRYDCRNGIWSKRANACIQTFLLFQNNDIIEWSRALADSRSAYTSLREHLLRYIDNPNEIGSALDPLDDDKNVRYSTYHIDLAHAIGLYRSGTIYTVSC